jgi:DNA repair protein RecN (Recombination protein N)
MLVELAIRDIVLIDRLDLSFTEGLSVLTGETGAGKSILLDAFALALGGRGDGSLVRHGQPQGHVSAVFEPPNDHPAMEVLRSSDLNPDGPLILRRVQMADGRTRAFINDQSVSIQTLKHIGGLLVEIHGQHDDRALMDPASHRAILDAFGGLQAEVAAVFEAARELREARQKLNEQQARIIKARQQVDYLRHAVDELGALAPQEGEETALSAHRQTMMQAEKVASDLQEALDMLAGHHSPVPALSSTMRKLHRRTEQAPQLIEPSVSALNTALDAIDEARLQLEQALRAADFDPKDLERTEERLFALRAASRKYNVSCDALAALQARYRDDVAAIDAGEEQLGALEQQVSEAEQAYKAAATLLSARRHEAASLLDRAVQTELPPLKLERARFITHVVTDEEARDASGFERVEFWAQTNPGTKAGPLMKVASGGELSRFMLALKVVLADKGSAPTLVFDEIDSGVGGAVADAIGQRLARLSSRVQVMAVTHAPQVAAQARTHFLIAKHPHPEQHERIVTSVTPLIEEMRREEIARMLAGATITHEARAAATRLLAGAA